jgi:hypothetical protein
MGALVCLCWDQGMTAGGVDDDLFLIQFLPIYLADSASAWLDHLTRNMIEGWEDLKQIFTGNFH